MFYSDKLKIYEEELPVKIAAAVEEIRQFFSLHELPIFRYDAYRVCIRVFITVSTPPLGTIGNVDIKGKEPILIIFNRISYPYGVPIIESDRDDFPKNILSHLYATGIGEPARLCLVRNNPNEWFANHTISDLMAIVEEWFFKAATGTLTQDANEFDPLRLEKYSGYHIYKYELLRDVIKNDTRCFPDFSYALLFSYVYKNGYENYEHTYRSLAVIPFIQLSETVKSIKDFHLKMTDTNAEPLLSILVWSPEEKIEEDYLTDLPSNFKELVKFFTARGINIKQVLTFHIKNNHFFHVGIPIIYAMKRPAKLIGCEGDYEFINFVFKHDEMGTSYKNESKVLIQSHIEPFSQNLAKKLTGGDIAKSSLYIGAGSLGSKMIMHSGRSGNINIGVCDDDDFLQHNLVRHALLNNSIGGNKSEAIVKELNALNQTDVEKQFSAYPHKVYPLTKKELDSYEYIIDTTAATDLQNWLILTEIPLSLKVHRGEIVNKGSLGLFYIEGRNRNPRIDDLINTAYFMATTKPFLEAWRRNDMLTELDTLDIGLGCSSTTVIMADDTISIHAGVFSRVITNNNIDSLSENGLVYFNEIQDDNIPIINSSFEIIKPFEVYPCNAGSGWSIRLQNGLTERLLNLCKDHAPIETGGVLIGVCSYKTQTIHVFDIVEEPQDSKGTCTGFTRGVKGLPEEIEWFKEKTGNIMGYIGEWHSHPMDLEGLSSRDEETISDLIRINKKTPIPTLAIIVTTQKVLPFIFNDYE